MPEYRSDGLRNLIRQRGISEEDVQQCLDEADFYHRVMETVYRGKTSDGRHLKVAVDHFGVVANAFTHH